MKDRNYVTAQEFAEKVGLSPQAVNKSEKLKEYRKKIAGKSYVHIDAFKLYGINYCVSTITRPRNDLRNTGETAKIMEMMKKMIEQLQILTEENRKLKNQILLLPGTSGRTKRIKIIPVK